MNRSRTESSVPSPTGLGISNTTPSPILTPNSSARKRPSTMLRESAVSTSKSPSTKLMVLPETSASCSGKMPLTSTAFSERLVRIMPSICTTGAADTTPGSSSICSRTCGQASSSRSEPVTKPCAVILSRRSLSSPSKPFITDKMTINAATPSAIPASDIRVMKETNRVRLLARK